MRLAKLAGGTGILLCLALSAHVSANPVAADQGAAPPQAAGTASGQSEPDWVPGSTYDPAIPTIHQVLGFSPGTQMTSFYETETLLHRWAAISNRAKLIPYGKDYEGKTLYMLVVSSPENIAALDKHVGKLGKLADPRTLGAGELDGIVRNTPAAVMVSTIDTSEASSVEAMQVVAYQLLAGTDARTKRILDNVLTYIIPVENPSARERYVSWYRTAQSRIIKTDPNAAEHNEPWGIGNDANHYQLDPNRDMVPLKMLEGQAKVKLIRDWRPELALDIHEMGVDSTFFFPPYPEPYNTNLSIDWLKKWWNIYAQDMRQQFDRRGWRYYSGDSFGSPFLGMHTLYTQYHGMIGILFEQAAGSGGLAIERRNGSILTLNDRIEHHVTGIMSYLDTTVANREDLHRDFQTFFASSMNGVPGVAQKAYVFPPDADPNKMSQFIDSLLAHGIEVQRTTQPFSMSQSEGYYPGPRRKDFPAGSYVVSLRQPLSRLANALLEKEPFHSIPVFYDVSVWALPYLYGIDGYWTNTAPKVATEPVTQPLSLPNGVIGGQAGTAYVWPYRGALDAAAAYALAEKGVNLYVHPGPFEIGGQSYGPAFVVPIDENELSVHEKVEATATRFPVRIQALSTVHSTSGSDLGSGVMRPVSKPSVAVVTRDGTDITSWGSFYFFFDQMYGLPFTPISINDLTEADLRRYNTIILPDGGQTSGRGGLRGKPYEWYFRESGTRHLKTWVEQGGTLITVKGGTAFAAADGGALTSTESQGVTKQTPGAIVEVKANGRSPLTIGYPQSFHVLARNTRLFTAGENGKAVLSYSAPDKLKIAGYLTEGDHASIAGSDFLITEAVGKGNVIMFAEDPNLRNQWTHLHQLLFNAILFGPLVR
ncbi:M14 family zinc carboxypeptidase [Sphingomonas flavalba]|uniref:M14 family zinc carboxypeptidase n=1 Tax=Sphingomonas flavalba TaxID=2559804 RepID=UPI001447F0B4|nr:M14 family zinc carboxypeptidase [Sphingomonas flavalba]